MATMQLDNADIFTTIDRIFAAGVLTYDDRQRLKGLLLDESTTDKQLIAIERVIDAVRQGKLQVKR